MFEPASAPDVERWWPNVPWETKDGTPGAATADGTPAAE